MKKVTLILATGIMLAACSSEKKGESEIPKNSDLTAQHLKGAVATMEETSYTPDSLGKVGAMDSCCVIIQEFDAKGYTTKSITKNSKGDITDESVMSRYEGGQMKEVVNMKNGKTTGTFSIQIDENGKYIGAQAKDSAGKMTSYYTGLTEDEYGAVTSGTEHKPDSSVKSSFVSEYNTGMQTSVTAKDSSGKVIYTYKAELNEKGEVAKSTTVEVGKDSSTTKVLTYTYDSFDEQGNWTQRTTYDDKGKATKVVKRTFTYLKKE